MRATTCLQINMHPLDHKHVVMTLEHQLRQWGGQVDKVLLTVDTRQSATGRYRGAGYEEARTALFDYLAEVQSRHANVTVEEVDYSAPARELVRRTFFRRLPGYPEKAFDGGPFHAYFFGLMRADADYVLHMDSDMLFGGGSQTWMSEAVALLKSNPDVVFAGPLPGPARADGRLNDAHDSFPGLNDLAAPQKLDLPYPAFSFESVSTRVFVIDMERFMERVGSIELVRPNLKRRIRARLFRQQPDAMPAEEVLTGAMRQYQLNRVDFLGTGAGMYSIHPIYRSPSFYRDLPGVIARIEAGDIPEGQRGDFDLNSSMIDWSEALRERTVWKRARRIARQFVTAQRQAAR